MSENKLLDILAYGFVRGEIYNIIEKCGMDADTFETFNGPWDMFYLYRTEDIERLRSGFDVTALHLLAADGYANHIRQQLAEVDEKTYEPYLKYHLATCERRDMLGYSHHTLDVFRKN